MLYRVQTSIHFINRYSHYSEAVVRSFIISEYWDFKFHEKQNNSVWTMSSNNARRYAAIRIYSIVYVNNYMLYKSYESSCRLDCCAFTFAWNWKFASNWYYLSIYNHIYYIHVCAIVHYNINARLYLIRHIQMRMRGSYIIEQVKMYKVYKRILRACD